MAKIFITGSADGLGQMAASLLLDEGHEVVMHARNNQRSDDIKKTEPRASGVVIGDLADFGEAKSVAKRVNDLGTFDAVIHNAGVYQVSTKIITAVNTLAPYILTCLIKRPKRLIYLSSDMHAHGRPNIANIVNQRVSYSDSKLHNVMFAMAIARRWKDVYSNAVDPGWVATKMGGHGAPDDLQKGFETQAWLAVSNDSNARVSGQHFYHKKPSRHNPEAANVDMQDKLIAVCEQITGLKLD